MQNIHKLLWDRFAEAEDSSNSAEFNEVLEEGRPHWFWLAVDIELVWCTNCVCCVCWQNEMHFSWLERKFSTRSCERGETVIGCAVSFCLVDCRLDEDIFSRCRLPAVSQEPATSPFEWLSSVIISHNLRYGFFIFLYYVNINSLSKINNHNI